MTKSSKKTQARQTTRAKAANLEAVKPPDAIAPREASPQEPFIVTAQRLGNALADVATHPCCPKEVANAISELDTQIFNQCNDVEISLRHSFPYRLVEMLEEYEDE